MPSPETVYINRASYNELSDNVELTEERAMRQLQEFLRLRGLGVKVNYYLMDAVWYSADSAFRSWRKPHWPDGPGRWLQTCLDNGVKPGLWFPTNSVFRMPPHPSWEGSIARGGRAASMFEGAFLRDNG